MSNSTDVSPCCDSHLVNFQHHDKEAVWVLIYVFLLCQGTDEPVSDDMQRLEQQAQAVATSKDVSAKLKEKVLFVR